MASQHFMVLAVLAVLLGCSSAKPRPRSRQPLYQNNPLGYPSSTGLPPVVNQVFRNLPKGAQLINMQPILPAIRDRLPDNYTLIRPNVVDTFRCSGNEFQNGYRNYGYYADQDNGCQIFHVCLPLQQLYPNNFTNPITYQFSFICPEYTIFSQDALVCAWANEAIPCEAAATFYNVNNYFFTNQGLDGETYGNKVEIRYDSNPSYNRDDTFG